MLRITSGRAKGRKISTPNIPEYRAIQDKAKLAIFSILGKKILGAKCLDLYAGSGNLGIEALSRGARFCDFVDESRRAEETILKNLELVCFLDRAEVYRQDAIKFAADAFSKYDVIFVDPFFKDTHFRHLFQQLEEILNEKGVIFFSHGEDTSIKDALINTNNLVVHDEKRYGSAHITVIKTKD